MKLSITSLVLTSMAGFASAAEVFDPPIPFVQYDGSCDAEVIYEGEIISIAKLTEGSFCIAENIVDEETGEAEMSYSRVDVVECTEEKIYEDWHSCDADCVTCDVDYMAYTNWESSKPEDLIGYCFDYFFSLDDISVASTRMFEQTKQINFSFTDGAKTEDVEAYLNMMDNHSCIAAGPPTVEISKGTDTTDTEVPDDVADVDADADADDSGASSLVATAAVAMAAATTMLLA